MWVVSENKSIFAVAKVSKLFLYRKQKEKNYEKQTFQVSK